MACNDPWPGSRPPLPLLRRRRLVSSWDISGSLYLRGSRIMSAWLSRCWGPVRAVCARPAADMGLRRGLHSLAGPRSPQTSAPSTGSSKLAPRLKWHAARGLSTTVGKIIKYGELKELLKNKGVTHIDVREPWEVKEFGVINGTINIPIGDLMAALQMTPKDFEEKYHQELPNKSDTVVFSCLAGIRSQKALDVASSLGYSR